jgi:phosphatidate cytidylyltransferase
MTAASWLGSLVMSAIKRSLSAKDWGTMIKGHGEILDWMDSICFAAPLFFHLTRYFFSV